ncbi:MAG: type III secretion T3S chaperone [Chlamydiia bacterium]
MKKPKYPLEEVAQIKKKRYEEAEKALKEKKEFLSKEEKKLQQFTKDLELIKQHKIDKIRQMIDDMEEGTTSDQIIIKERYLKVVVEEKLKKEQEKVTNQKKEVQKAKEEVEKARLLLEERRQDVEKFRLHREDWEKEMKVILEAEDVKETDEIGTTIHTARKYRPGGR